MFASANAGQVAALGAATCWAFSSLAFEAAARRLGALTLNLIRLVFALGFLSVATWLVRGLPLPLDASPHAWRWLAVSGLIGFVFGDFCLFRAYVAIGPRLSMLMMALSPPLTAVLGWLLLGEKLTGRTFLGMALTMTGIGLAIWEGKPKENPGAAEGERRPRPAPRGLAFGFFGALGQAGGLVLSKIGMEDYPAALAATQVRVIAGILGYILLFSVFRWWQRVGLAGRDRSALGFASLGAFFGPFLGVSLSLFAVRRTVAGVAASLMATTPVIIIPLVLVRGERVGIGGFVGALVAVAGVALLFL